MARSVRAAMVMPSILIVSPVRVRLIYFYAGADLDHDNILKPMLDALVGLTYVDGRQVMDLYASKRDLAGRYVIEGVSPVLAGYLATRPGGDFVFLQVEPSDPTILP